MAEGTLRGMKIAILATSGVEQAELTESRRALEEAGAQTVLISPKKQAVQGFKHFDKAEQFTPQMSLEEANPNNFDGVLLPGGALNADALRVERKAQDFVRTIDESDKPLAVICHGPWLLVSAGLVDGRKLTSYHTIQDDIRNAGGEWIDKDVVLDENWVSSRQPSDIPAFNRKMVDLFAEIHSKATHAA
jgi:protease I